VVRDQPQAIPQAESWLAEHGDALWAFASSRAPAGSVEDLVQDTLVAGIAAWSSFDRRASVRTWLVSIMSHKIADLYRRRARERSEAPAPEPEDEFTPAGKWVRVPSEWSGRADAEVLDALRRCHEQLPTLLRDTIELRDLRGIESETVCQVLGVSPTNLWTRLHRARTALRRCIEGALDRARPGSDEC
jgi:RNA polymerase sigma-70 factor, ECF subfamily